MRLSTMCCQICLAIVLCMAVVSSLESPKNSPSTGRYTVRKTNCETKKSFKSWSKSLKNDSLAILSRVTKKTNPVNFIRRQLGSKKLYDPSDPLHAYPNKWDLIVHSIFQKLSRFEVNNADAIRKGIRIVRVLAIIVILVGFVALVLPLALPLTAALALGRREDEFEDKNDVIDWKYVDRISQSVIYAIENGMLKYEM